MDNELECNLMKLTENEIISLLKSNTIERQLRKEIYALYTMKRIERLIIGSLPFIANLGVAYAVSGVVQKEVNKIMEDR